MSIEVLIIIFIIYLLLCFLLYHLGESRKLRGWRIGLISLLLTPVVGFIVYFFSPGRMVSIEKRYRCPECKYEFTQNEEFCPICKEQGKDNKLFEVNRNMV
jgi:hypothetical protein